MFISKNRDGARFAVLVPILLTAAVLVPGSSLWASSINIDGLLTNSSFSANGGFGSCPTGWTCTGSPTPGFTVYQPTANPPATGQYNPATDGIGSVAPGGSGSWVAVSPTYAEGGGDLSQTTSGVWASNTMYTISFWEGVPLTLPNGAQNPTNCPPSTDPTCTVTEGPTTFELYLLGNGSINPTDFPSSYPIDLVSTEPAAGDWTLVTETFTTPSNFSLAGDAITVDFHVATSANYQAINLAFASVPEPAYNLLLAGGLGLLILFARKRLRA